MGVFHFLDWGYLRCVSGNFRFAYLEASRIGRGANDDIVGRKRSQNKGDHQEKRTSDTVIFYLMAFTALLRVNFCHIIFDKCRSLFDRFNFFLGQIRVCGESKTTL